MVGPRTKVVDLRGRTVLPGLIDAHVHVLGMAADDAALRQRMTGELPSNLRRFLQHGITSIRSPGDPMPYIIELRNRLNAGELPGPRLVVTGATITSQNGHPASTCVLRTCSAGGPQSVNSPTRTARDRWFATM